jgi:hypothetical protein
MEDNNELDRIHLSFGPVVLVQHGLTDNVSKKDCTTGKEVGNRFGLEDGSIRRGIVAVPRQELAES